MKFLDPDDPFFRPMWRRRVTVAVPLLWACVEYLSGNPAWALLFAGLGVYASWHLILKPKRRPAPPPPEDQSDR